MSLWEFLFYSGIHAYEGCYSFHAQSGEEAYNMAILMANIVEKNSEILTPATVVSLQTILLLPLP